MYNEIPALPQRARPYVTASWLVLLTGVGDEASAVPPSGPPRPALDDAAAATATPAPIRLELLLQRLEQQNQKLAEQNAQLAEQNARLAKQNQSLAQQLEGIRREGPPTASSAQPPAPGAETSASPAAADQSLPRINHPTPAPPPSKSSGDELADRQGQLVIARHPDGPTPFELRADLFSQVRYTNFARQTDYWIDSAGQIQPVRTFDSLELNRNFIQLSGYAIDPRLQFTANLFSSTSINSTVYLGWINYQFDKAFDLRIGNWLVPGTREWYESFRYTLGADRLMATTFFRPNISPGIWAQGQPIENLYYVAMLANSLNRFNQGVERIGSAIAFGGTLWWEPQGPFGPGPSDIEYHAALGSRIGTNVAFSHEPNQGFGSVETGNPEDTILRLSDGTPLFRPGALAPGVELRSANVNLWTIDGAIKYRGFGLSAEYFFRWLDHFNFQGGQLPMESVFDHGGLLQGGYFVMPGRFEGFARTSFVSGMFGGGYEVGGGVNWYIRGTRDWRMTFEVLSINRSPAQNLLTGYRAGESGTLYQLQLFTDFF